jgi:ribosomal protein L36
MSGRRSIAALDARVIAAEIVRRAGRVYVIRLSDPPTASERLQLMAARLLRTPIAIMPTKCVTVDEWLARYGPDRRLS